MPSLRKINPDQLTSAIVSNWPYHGRDNIKVYGVPNGGTHLAVHLSQLGLAVPVSDPKFADLIVDDLVASGKTRQKWMTAWPTLPFWTPFEVNNSDEWLVFPWEEDADDEGESIVYRFLQRIGEDPTREGLVETPKRVVKSWKELYAGYDMDPKEILSKQFQSDNDQMVICKGIEFYSTCEHHVIPIIGTAHIGYIPGGTVVGLSKLARLVEVFARRLQIQEQMTQQIADAIMSNIPDVSGCGVVIEAKHLCMCARGIKKQNSVMTTSALLGSFRDLAVREEFFRLINFK